MSESLGEDVLLQNIKANMTNKWRILVGAQIALSARILHITLEGILLFLRIEFYYWPKYHHTFPNLDNGIHSFYHSYSSNGDSN